jgi:hypothetical protein
MAAVPCAWCGCVGTHEPHCLGAATIVGPFDPTETRRAAHQAIQPEKNRLQAVVLDCIRAAGRLGRTTDEVEVATKLPHQTASARVNELHNAGAIVAAGKRRTRSGRHAIVYVVRTP